MTVNFIFRDTQTVVGEIRSWHLRAVRRHVSSPLDYCEMHTEHKKVSENVLSYIFKNKIWPTLAKFCIPCPE